MLHSKTVRLPGSRELFASVIIIANYSSNGQIYHTNQCYCGAPCLFSEQHRVNREDVWDHYSPSTKSYITLECKLHQKYWMDSPLVREEEENYLSGLSTQSREHLDLQLYDSNGIWFTHSDDPECYWWPPESDIPKTCIG